MLDSMRHANPSVSWEPAVKRQPTPLSSLAGWISRVGRNLARVIANPIRGTRLSAGSLAHRAENVGRANRNESREAALLRQERALCLGTLTASIVHEVNNPLSFMLPNLQQAKKSASEIREVVNRLVLFADRATRRSTADGVAQRMGEQALGGRSIDSILAEIRELEESLSEAMEGAERILQVSENLQRLGDEPPASMGWEDIEAIVDTALQVVDAGDVQIVRRQESPEPLPQILCQQHQVAQVLIDLLQNAVEALAGSGRIDVRTRRSRDWVEVEVADDGPGIDAGQVDRVFRTFHSTKSKGVGLGLAISRRIVESHGGRLEAIAIRPGACFRLQLPIGAR